MGHAQAFIEKAIEYSGDECLIWPFALDSNGYPKATYRGKTASVHVVVCEAQNGPKPAGKEAAHSCGTKRCVTRAHLDWKTRLENMADVVAMGRSNRGGKTWKCKLSVEDVARIRSLAGTKLNREIAAEYGVSTTQITRIINRQSWNWIT